MFQVKDSRGQVRQRHRVQRGGTAGTTETSTGGSVSARRHETLRPGRSPHEVTYTFAHRPSEEGGPVLWWECLDETRQWASRMRLESDSMVRISETEAPVTVPDFDGTIRAWEVLVKCDPPTERSWKPLDKDLWQASTQNPEHSVRLLFQDLPPPSDTASVDDSDLVPSIEFDDQPSAQSGSTSVEDAAIPAGTATAQPQDAVYLVTLEIWRRREEIDERSQTEPSHFGPGSPPPRGWKRENGGRLKRT